jgi:peptidoglycan/xylan/chitin deacetylase (PgdA/CDA1 family)
VAWTAARQVPKVVGAAADLVRKPATGLVVLIYHRVGRRSDIEVDLALATFSEQMAFLADHAEVVTLTEGLARVADPHAPRDPIVAVTFDDGTADFADLAVPVLVAHRVPATVYLATDFLERGEPFPGGGTPLSWSALADTLTTGLVEVGSHTHHHALLDRLPDDQIAPELDRSIELIGERTGMQAAHFAYPKAILGSRAAEDAVRARFHSAALAGTRANRYCGTDAFRVARSPIQVSDGMRWFRHKVAGGLAFEDTVRRATHRARDYVT